MSKIIEAGHIYGAKSKVTVWSENGWSLMKKFKEPGDKTLLLMDNRTSYDAMPDQEKACGYLSSAHFEGIDYLVPESSMNLWGWRVFQILKDLGEKKGAKLSSNGIWYCSGIPLIRDEDNFQFSILYDAGLSLFKKYRGFDEALNILPHFYEKGQKDLMKLVSKAMPEFNQRVVLFNSILNYWEI